MESKNLEVLPKTLKRFSISSHTINQGHHSRFCRCDSARAQKPL